MAASTAGEMPPTSADVVIVGNGPSAMILSYILHGNVPLYDSNRPHPDPLLHEKLRDAPQLLHLDIPGLTDHFEASRFSYSTQALPVNSLLDALVRPGGETDDDEENTCVRWRHVPETALSHVVLGDASSPGGQWTECPPGTKWDIQSLSYAGMLSLPGYSFHMHHKRMRGTELPAFTRPSRREISEYLAAYPAAVGIDGCFRCGERVAGITRLEGGGFHIGSHNIQCKNIVLASGIFTEPKPARPLLQPLLDLEPSSTPVGQRPPLLVIGSGFSAADLIVSAPPDQRFIHIFKWEPDLKPSPLKGCHQQAYPEYAGIYRLMKRAALFAPTSSGEEGRARYPPFRRALTSFLGSRDWGEMYEGLPNTRVIDVAPKGENAVVTLRFSNGFLFTREVSGLAYAVGRKGSLKYLDDNLRGEVLGNSPAKGEELISAGTLRSKALSDLEVARGVFIIGSLTGDSLIRFAHGGCVYASGKLISSARGAAGTLSLRDDEGGTDADKSLCTGEKEDPGSSVEEGERSPDHVDVTASPSCNGTLYDRRRSSIEHASRKGRSRKRSWWGSCFFSCR